MSIHGFGGYGVEPDYPVARTIQDMIAGTDCDLEIALKPGRNP